MKYEILFLGKTKDNFLTEGIAEYSKRLKHYAGINLKTIKIGKIQGSDQLIKDKETDLLLSHTLPSTHLIALDGGGKSFTSKEFSREINKWEKLNLRHITFVIGGPLGLSERMLGLAKEKISLSKMTFTHDMVRLFLLEQLYRAYTIKAGEKYHK